MLVLTSLRKGVVAKRVREIRLKPYCSNLDSPYKTKSRLSNYEIEAFCALEARYTTD